MKNRVFIHQGTLEYIAQCMSDYPEIETGGDLFGTYLPSGEMIIQTAIGSGPNAYRSAAFYKQDKNFLNEVGRLLYLKYGIHHLANWHKHPASLTTPSDHDSNTMFKAIKNYQLKQFLLVIGVIQNKESIINGFMYSGDDTKEPVDWVILPGISPIEELMNRDFPKNLRYIPKTKKARLGELSTQPIERIESTYEAISCDESVFYNSEDGLEILHSIYNGLLKCVDQESIKMMQMENSLDFEVTDGKSELTISLPNDYPNSKYKVNIKTGLAVKVNHILKTKLDKDGSAAA